MYLNMVFLALTWIGLSCAIQLPEDLVKCHYGDNKCILESTNHLIRRYGKGSSKYGLPAIDGIRVEDIVIIDSAGALRLTFKLKNQLLKGLENATVTSLSGLDRQPELNKIEIKLQIPSLVMQAIHDLQLHGLIFHLNSSGTTKSDMQNVRITSTIKCFIEYRNNKRYLRVYDMTPQLEMDRWILTSDDLYAENTDLTVILNRVLNDNWVEVWNEIEPNVLSAYSRSILNIVNTITQAISYDDLFLPD